MSTWRSPLHGANYDNQRTTSGWTVFQNALSWLMSSKAKVMP
ncbi:hypothetical protein R2A130_2825 [Ahrensia sp. R2A130]|nr:hypothetical protein R2A130_2825 [Ahrensia sp. R2A130]